MKKLTIFLLLLISTINIFSENPVQTEWNDSSSVSGKYLGINIGAEASGMGNAYTGMAKNAISIFWNPAGLNNMQKEDIEWNLFISHNMWIQDMMMDNIALGKYIKNIGVVGFGISYFSAGEIEKYDIDEYGNPVERGNFYPYALTFNLAYSNKMDKDIDFGVNFKYILDSIDNNFATTFAFDIGVRYFSPIKNLSFNIVAKNFAGRLNEFVVLKELVFGIFYSLEIQQYLINFDYDLIGEVNNNPLHKFGIEIITPFSLILRSGYQTDNTQIENGFKNFTFGIGFSFQDKFVDFAFEPYGEIGNAFKLSLGGNF